MLKLLIEALRVWRPPAKRIMKHESSLQRGGSNLSTRQTGNMINEDRELTNLISIREEGASPMPSLADTPEKLEETVIIKEPEQPPLELQSHHSNASQLSGKVEHSSAEDENDADSLRSNAGSRQSLLKYSENIAKD